MHRAVCRVRLFCRFCAHVPFVMLVVFIPTCCSAHCLFCALTCSLCTSWHVCCAQSSQEEILFVSVFEVSQKSGGRCQCWLFLYRVRLRCVRSRVRSQVAGVSFGCFCTACSRGVSWCFETWFSLLATHLFFVEGESFFAWGSKLIPFQKVLPGCVVLLGHRFQQLWHQVALT